MESPELTQAKAEITRLNNEMEKKVEERTRQLATTNEALRTEIAERKLAAEAVQQAEDRTRLIINTIPTMAWSLRADGALDFINQRWLEYAGLSLEEAIAEPTRPMHSEELPMVMGKWLQDMDAGEPFEAEMRLRRADGQYRWFLVRTEPLRDEHGNIVKWFGSSIDIEDRKLAEDALRQSEFDLAEAQRVARIGSWTLDIVTNAVRWSEELYRIFDVEKTAFGGTHEDFLYRVHPDDRTRVLQVNAEAKSSGKPFAVEYRIKTRSDQLKDIRELGFARKDRADAVVGLFGTAQDITDRKRAEKDLEEANRQLKLLSRRRVKVQEEERRHLARELHDEIGQALTAAKINLQAALEEPDHAKSKRIHETTAILERLLGQVRQISLNLRPSTLDDLGLVPALRSLLDEQGRLASVAVRFSAKNMPENLDPEIQTTCFRIAQEAITNAVRHARSTQISVELSLENGNLRLQIRDNGTGFDAESAQAQTTGLGLIGMKERAALVGGRTRIVASRGKGATVDVTLPLTS
jgi:PAS domain S-box-containing protein